MRKTSGEQTASLLRVNTIEPGVNFPFSRSWAYKHVHLKTFPGLFVKIGSSVLIDMARFRELQESGRLG